MTSKFPSASHLLNDEVDYELKLRNQNEECSNSLDSKQRTLRRLFHMDRSDDREYRSIYSIDQEFDLISSRVNTIAASLAQAYDIKLISRLKHYHMRAQRSKAETFEAKTMKDSLVKQITDLITTHKLKYPLLPVGEQEESSQEENGNEGAKGIQKGGLERSTEDNNDASVSQVNLAHKVQNLETQMNQMMSMLQQMLAKQLQNEQKQNQPEVTDYANRTGAIPKNQRSHFFPATQSESSVKNVQETANPGSNFVGSSVGMFDRGETRCTVDNGQSFPGGRVDSSLQHSSIPLQLPDRGGLPYADYRPNNPMVNPPHRFQREQLTGISGVGQPGHVVGTAQQSDWYNGARHENYRSSPLRSPSINESIQRESRMQYDRRIEKWNIFFSGSPRSPTLEDFIYKVKVLASMNGIPWDSLISHIHLLLRDEASNWFFTYYEANWNWNEFETRIRYRFGNPNQDQGNRQQIYERKQLKGETFIAFVTEVERLNKLLTNPLPSQRKFEIIWENMLQHYRSKLACFQVDNLDQLIQLNYRIDASNPSLHPVGPKHAVHNLEMGSEDEPSDEEEINELSRRYQRQSSSRPQQKSGGRSEDTNRSPLCWNCRKTGHFWRECKEAKTTFCYVCGNPGKISTTCDSHPKRESVRGGSAPQNSGN